MTMTATIIIFPASVLFGMRATPAMNMIIRGIAGTRTLLTLSPRMSMSAGKRVRHLSTATNTTMMEPMPKAANVRYGKSNIRLGPGPLYRC